MRKEVTAFAETMETRMAAFDEKKGDRWRDCDSVLPLFERLKSKVDSLNQATEEYEKAYARKVPRTDLTPLREKVLQVAADAGNYAMLIADVCYALPDPVPATEPAPPMHKA